MYPVYEATRSRLADEAKARTAASFESARAQAKSSTEVWTYQTAELTRITEDYMRRGYLRYDNFTRRWGGAGDYHRVSAYIRQLAKEMKRPFITVAVDGYFSAQIPNRKYLAPITAPLIMLCDMQIGEYTLSQQKASDHTTFTAHANTPYRADRPEAAELPHIKRWIERIDTDPVWRAAMRANTPFR